MKNKIFEMLRTKYAHLGLNKEVLEGVATQLSTFVTEETQVEPAVNGAEQMLKSFQAYADNRVNTFKTESEKYKGEVDALKAQLAKKGNDPKEEKENPDLEKLFAEKLQEIVKPLQEKIQTFENKEKANERQNLILSKVRELGIPQWRIQEGFAITDDMDEAKITEYLSTVKQNIQSAGLSTKGGLPIDDGKKANIEEVKGIVNNLMN